MNPPQGINMQDIIASMQRRSTGASTQMTQPSGQLPTGGAPTPVPNQAPPVPQNVQQNVTPGNQGAPVSPEGSVVGKLKQGAAFDDETKTVAKQLVAKLIGVL